MFILRLILLVVSVLLIGFGLFQADGTDRWAEMLGYKDE